MLERNMKTLPINFVVKGWGWESWIANNELYCGKILFFKKGKQCSFHYHKVKDETMYLAQGRILMIYSEEDDLGKADSVILEPGDVFYVPPGLRHRMYGELDSHLYEFSTQHFDEDSYRIVKGD